MRRANDISILQEQKNKFEEAQRRWDACETLRQYDFKRISPLDRTFLEDLSFHVSGGDVIILRPCINHFLTTVRADFDPFIVTAASQGHAHNFLRAFDSEDSDAKYYDFFTGILNPRLFCTEGLQKSLAGSTETSTLSTIIIDDCSDGHGYVKDKGTWGESDESNVWRIKAWTPLLSDLDGDLQLKYLAGTEEQRGAAGSSAQGTEGILHRCRRRFLTSLAEDSWEMRRQPWYDSSPSMHKPVEAIRLHGIDYYLKKEKGRHDEAMSKGAEKVERASRSPSPTGRSGSFYDEPFWIVPDTSSLMRQAQQSLNIGRSDLEEFAELHRHHGNVVKIFIPCAVKEEITNHGKTQRPELFKPAKVISDFNSTYVRQNFVVFEDETDGDVEVRKNRPRTLDDKQYRDHRIIKSAERKKDALQVKVPGKISCVILSNDKDQTTEVHGTAPAAGKQPLYAMTLAQLQRFMYNISQESVRKGSKDQSCRIPHKLWIRDNTLIPQFFDSTSSSFGISTLSDLPETMNVHSYRESSISIEWWLKQLQREGFGPGSAV
mmetsp:Transcript_65633/g.180012  ORF Transcript_65633/g.180012 Transcript_65633/m.180012 type:complete len:547 (+) Transcript_65633:1228-2868(+)